MLNDLVEGINQESGQNGGYCFSDINSELSDSSMFSIEKADNQTPSNT